MSHQRTAGSELDTITDGSPLHKLVQSDNLFIICEVLNNLKQKLARFVIANDKSFKNFLGVENFLIDPTCDLLQGGTSANGGQITTMNASVKYSYLCTAVETIKNSFL